MPCLCGVLVLSTDPEPCPFCGTHCDNDASDPFDVDDDQLSDDPDDDDGYDDDFEDDDDEWELGDEDEDEDEDEDDPLAGGIEDADE